MKDLKTKLEEVYADYQADDLRMRRMHQNIMNALPKEEEMKSSNSKRNYIATAASFTLVLLSYFIWKQSPSIGQNQAVMAKLDVIADELVQEEVLEQTTLSYGSPEDAMMQVVAGEMAKMNQEDLEQIFEEI